MRDTARTLLLAALLPLTLAGCDEGLDPHWACLDLQSHATACASHCSVATLCEEHLATLDASELDALGACATCLAEEADTGTCRDCATQTTTSCRDTLATWLAAPCLAP